MPLIKLAKPKSPNTRGGREACNEKELLLDSNVTSFVSKSSLILDKKLSNVCQANTLKHEAKEDQILEYSSVIYRSK